MPALVTGVPTRGSRLELARAKLPASAQARTHLAAQVIRAEVVAAIGHLNLVNVRRRISLPGVCRLRRTCRRNRRRAAGTSRHQERAVVEIGRR